MRKRLIAIVLLTPIALVAAWQFSAADTTLPMGGPPELAERKDAILDANFAELDQEQERIDREKSAVRHALTSLNSRGGRNAQLRASLEQRARELTLKEKQIAESRSTLLALKRDRSQYEKLLVESYRGLHANEVTPAQETLVQLRPYETTGSITLEWPVDPAEGISAGFHDPSYEKRFGLAHNAIDIPVEQGTTVHAAENGVVTQVNDHGFGYNTLVVAHDGDIATVYGHVSEFLVAEGDSVSAGDPIALSGGRPGSKGAGLLTTGPHLHFEVLLHGSAIDPLYALPAMEVAIVE